MKKKKPRELQPLEIHQLMVLTSIEAFNLIQDRMLVLPKKARWLVAARCVNLLFSKFYLPMFSQANAACSRAEKKRV